MMRNQYDIGRRQSATSNQQILYRRLDITGQNNGVGCNANFQYTGRVVTLPPLKIRWVNDQEVDAVPKPAPARLTAVLWQFDIVQRFAAQQRVDFDFFGH